LRKEVRLLEGVLLELLEDKDEPNIYKVREILARLSKTQKRPNQKLDGDWEVYWASRDSIVEKVWGTGLTVGDALVELKEIVLQLGNRKAGRVVEAAEITSRIGPFPNTANLMKGQYSAEGATSVELVFDMFEDLNGEPIELPGGLRKKVLNLDVIYASKNMIALQSQETSNNECDFYVLKAVEDYEMKRDEFLGLTRRKYFFN